MSTSQNSETIGNLRSILDEIEQWLEENDMRCVYSAIFDRKTMPNALWGSKPHEWQDFLEAAKQTESKLIWIEVETCSVAGENELRELAPFAEDGLEDNFQELAGSLRRFEGQVVAFYLYWAYRGVLNAFILDAEWVEDYRDHRDQVEGLLQIAQRQLRQEEREQERRNSREETQEKARELLHHPKYHQCQNRNDRIFLANELFGQDINARHLVMQAETLDRMAP